MRPTARLGDKCTGHKCFPSRVNVTASDNVMINGRGAHRVGDQWAVHCCGPICHSSKLQSGSSTVFVNGRPLGRVGDPVVCGSKVMTGSNNVFCG